MASRTSCLARLKLTRATTFGRSFNAPLDSVWWEYFGGPDIYFIYMYDRRFQRERHTASSKSSSQLATEEKLPMYTCTMLVPAACVCVCV